MATFKTTYRVTWSDVDAAQVVHHSNYFRIFERVEEEFYQYLGVDLKYFTEQRFWLPRVEVFCHYKAPARFGDILEISLSIEEVKEKAVRYGYLVKKKDSSILLAEGYVVAVAADQKFRRAIDIPSEIIEKLKAFSEK